jgi:hypothetical protein
MKKPFNKVLMRKKQRTFKLFKNLRKKSLKKTIRNKNLRSIIKRDKKIKAKISKIKYSVFFIVFKIQNKLKKKLKIQVDLSFGKEVGSPQD